MIMRLNMVSGVRVEILRCSWTQSREFIWGLAKPRSYDGDLKRAAKAYLGSLRLMQAYPRGWLLALPVKHRCEEKPSARPFELLDVFHITWISANLEKNGSDFFDPTLEGSLGSKTRRGWPAYSDARTQSPQNPARGDLSAVRKGPPVPERSSTHRDSLAAQLKV